MPQPVIKAAGALLWRRGDADAGDDSNATTPSSPGARTLRASAVSTVAASADGEVSGRRAADDRGPAGPHRSRRPGGDSHGCHGQGADGRVVATASDAGSPPGDGSQGLVQFAVVHRPERKDWGFPKGKLEPGEHPAVAAVREVHEETGYPVALGRPLPTRRYVVDGRPKQVRYWVAQANELTRTPFTATPEVDEVRWLSAQAAREQLSYPHDAELLTAFDRLPVDTAPLLIVRHGKAVKRSAWRGKADSARPLEPRGTSQARRLVGLLAAYGVTQVFSSDATRCRETVLPYARSAGVDIHDEPLLSEDGHAGARKASRARVAELASTSGALVICTHRPVLPDTLTTILATARRREMAAIPPLAPGALLVLHRSFSSRGPRVVAMERHRS